MSSQPPAPPGAPTKPPLGSLRALWPFVRRHRGLFAGWLLALAVSSTASLSLPVAGQGLAAVAQFGPLLAQREQVAIPGQQRAGVAVLFLHRHAVAAAVVALGPPACTAVAAIPDRRTGRVQVLRPAHRLAQRHVVAVRRADLAGDAAHAQFLPVVEQWFALRQQHDRGGGA